ncbi:hypothetical protein ANCCAN_18564 [Ancylostoma caninum]|uniref:Uncharacterized protein n=1 Tax=Ancylostoma caninum TaxID=29170 RepID=A0A368FTL9_ANCCA|nr:hypothetical protein ANCCAN_18564 [Ancylostoma caninum]
MYQWSSSPFESLHRRLQIKLDQSTTNSAAAMIERYLLNKKVRLCLMRHVRNGTLQGFPFGVEWITSTKIGSLWVSQSTQGRASQKGAG